MFPAVQEVFGSVKNALLKAAKYPALNFSYTWNKKRKKISVYKLLNALGEIYISFKQRSTAKYTHTLIIEEMPSATYITDSSTSNEITMKRRKLTHL